VTSPLLIQDEVVIRIKICGITTPQDAAAVSAAGADAIGLNFSKESPRRVDVSTAWRIVLETGPFVAPIGIFVSQDELDNTPQVIHDAGLRGIQTYCDMALECEFGPTAHIPAFRVNDAASIKKVKSLLAKSHKIGMIHGAVLIDGHSGPGKAMGGTGTQAPWDLLAGVDFGAPLILAGGLTPENVADAIRIVKPWGIDVASGVESKPGVKDIAKVRDFIAAAREAASAL
jgi:phosphoribosylanthranilate isomerase